MKKGKLILSALAMFAVIGGALAFKANRSQDVLYYISTNGSCKTAPFLTTTNNADVNAPLPSGARTGWYTTSLCNSPITFATTSPR